MLMLQKWRRKLRRPSFPRLSNRRDTKGEIVGTFQTSEGRVKLKDCKSKFVRSFYMKQTRKWVVSGGEQASDFPPSVRISEGMESTQILRQSEDGSASRYLFTSHIFNQCYTTTD